MRFSAAIPAARPPEAGARKCWIWPVPGWPSGLAGLVFWSLTQIPAGAMRWTQCAASGSAGAFLAQVKAADALVKGLVLSRSTNYSGADTSAYSPNNFGLNSNGVQDAAKQFSSATTQESGRLPMFSSTAFTSTAVPRRSRRW